GVLALILLKLGMKQDELIDYNFYSQENISIFLFVSGAIGIVIFLITLFKISTLKSNPASICESMGAFQLSNDPKNFKEKQYRNIVEEMSIASSVPLPGIYILDDLGINAFACGYDINSAAICVTT